MAFLQILLPSIAVLVLKRRIFYLLSLADNEHKFAVEIKAGVSDGDCVEVSRVHNLLTDGRQHSQVGLVDKDYVELRDHE